MAKKYNEESSIQRLKKNMQGMSLEQKIQHILTYYWGTILLAILVPVLLVFILSPLFKDKPEFTFDGAFSNLALSQEGEYYLKNEWLSKVGVAPEKALLTIDLSTAGTFNQAQEIDSGIRVIAAVAADNLDYILCDNTALNLFSVQQAYLPLDQVLEEQVLAQWADRIYYFIDPEDGLSYPIALDVSDLPFVQDCVMGNGRIYFGFANKTEPDVERLQMFLAHLTAWKGS